MRTVRDAKATAKALRAEMAERHNVDLSHSECLEIVSRQFGVDNWNILAAHLDRVGPGATVDIWMAGLDELRERVITYVMGRNIRIWGPGIWVPDIHQVGWDARVLTLPDPFGNHLRLSEPNDKAAHDALPRWTLTG